jgi:glyoxylase-like metal-dependent hydrolase (beta-lactamase superfamily II)
MRRTKPALIALALVLWSFAAAQSAPLVRLWVLDCGTFLTSHESDACYLIQHGDRYMLWDLGLDQELAGQPPQMQYNHLVQLHVTLKQQLSRLGLTPDNIGIIALSHGHFDHVGQAPDFPHATLLLGKGDWGGWPVTRPGIAARFKLWKDGGAPKEEVEGDKDIFGDGTVVMFATPGHTPGHHSLLVKLRHTGAVMLSGDLYHSQQQYRDDEIPPGIASDSAAMRTSTKRFKDMATALHALVLIPHEAADMARLPLFPQAAD